MRGEWAYYKSRFTPDICDYILTEGLKLPANEATLGVNGTTGNDGYRKSVTRFIQKDNQTFNFLFDDLWRMAIESNREWFDFHISNVSFIQLAEYSDTYQGEYKKHHDVFWINGDPHYHRKLTCVIQLTDPTTYEGGDLELYELVQNSPDREDVRAQGTAIFFPSFIPHAALPVTKGTRHSLAVWFEGPKWR